MSEQHVRVVCVCVYVRSCAELASVPCKFPHVNVCRMCSEVLCSAQRIGNKNNMILFIVAYNTLEQFK